MRVTGDPGCSRRASSLELSLLGVRARRNKKLDTTLTRLEGTANAVHGIAATSPGPSLSLIGRGISVDCKDLHSVEAESI